MKTSLINFSVAKLLLFSILLIQFCKAIDIGYSSNLLFYLNQSIQNPQHSCFLNFSPEGKVCVIIFYGQGCPHCAQENEFWNNLLKNETWAQKIKLIKLEVYYNQTNQKIFEETAKKLNLAQNEIGVPLTIIENKPFLGFAYSKNSETTSPTSLDLQNFQDYYLFLIFIVTVFIIFFILLKRWKNAR